jgi:hypothetical protein
VRQMQRSKPSPESLHGGLPSGQSCSSRWWGGERLHVGPIEREATRYECRTRPHFVSFPGRVWRHGRVVECAGLLIRRLC